MSYQNSFLWTDIAGFSLDSEDREILLHPSISGVILFSRNFESIQQLKDLTNQIKQLSAHLIITVDQEGGRVQRFREGFTELPSMHYWSEQYQLNPQKMREDLKKTIQIMISELRAVGVYASLVPVLDINYNNNEVIGHRSFGDKKLVSTVGEIYIDVLHECNMPAIGKHFPGHGFVTTDSHFDLPIDDRDFKTIAENDLKPFEYLINPNKLEAIMPAHVVYPKCDSMPAGFSRFWLQTVLRKQLKFDGLIVCDDLTMQGAAQFGSYADRAHLALEAGCDIALVCNNRAGAIEILDKVKSPINPELDRRLQNYFKS